MLGGLCIAQGPQGRERVSLEGAASPVDHRRPEIRSKGQGLPLGKITFFAPFSSILD